MPQRKPSKSDSQLRQRQFWDKRDPDKVWPLRDGDDMLTYHDMFLAAAPRLRQAMWEMGHVAAGGLTSLFREEAMAVAVPDYGHMLGMRAKNGKETLWRICSFVLTRQLHLGEGLGEAARVLGLARMSACKTTEGRRAFVERMSILAGALRAAPVAFDVVGADHVKSNDSTDDGALMCMTESKYRYTHPNCE